MPTERFKQVANGLFHSKLVYCLTVFGNVWGLASNDQTNRRYTSFSKEDNRKLQVLQNQVLRLMTRTKVRETPTVTLLNQTNTLSVHQLTAFMTLISIQKVLFYKRPTYFFKKLVGSSSDNGDRIRTRQCLDLKVPKADLTQTRGGYSYRSAMLWNKLPVTLKKEMNPEKFRELAKDWVRSNINWKPT